MDQATLMIAASVIIFNAVLLYFIVQSATKSYKRHQLQVASLYLLAKIAKKQGVEVKEVDDLSDWAKNATM